MVDLHSHILPGLDDGAPDVEASVALARAAVAAGTTTLVATPHVSLTYDTRPDAVSSGIEALRARLADERIPLELVAGAEIAVPRLSELDDDGLGAFAIGDGPYLLVESPYSASPFLEDTVFGLMTRGFKPILAHPALRAVPARPLRSSGWWPRGCCARSPPARSAAASGGFRSASAATCWRRPGARHLLGRARHRPPPPGLREGLAAMAEELPEMAPQVDWFAHDAPRRSSAAPRCRRGRPPTPGRSRPRWRRQLTDWRRR